MMEGLAGERESCGLLFFRLRLDSRAISWPLGRELKGCWNVPALETYQLCEDMPGLFWGLITGIPLFILNITGSEHPWVLSISGNSWFPVTWGGRVFSSFMRGRGSECVGGWETPREPSYTMEILGLDDFWGCPLKTDPCNTLLSFSKGQRFVQPVTYGPHIAKDSYECGPTQTVKLLKIWDFYSRVFHLFLMSLSLFGLGLPVTWLHSYSRVFWYQEIGHPWTQSLTSDLWNKTSLPI